jgi:hypothetical protein
MKYPNAVFLLALFVGLSVTGKPQSKPTNVQTPVTAEELKLYGYFLDSFLGSSSEPTPISFSDRTLPLVLNPPDKDACLQEIGFKISGKTTHTSHLIPASIASNRPMYIVDPNDYDLKDRRSGLLSVSEIGFDKGHHFAVFTFKLVQIGLGGGMYMRGGTLVFRRVNDKWKRENSNCLDWMT